MQEERSNQLFYQYKDSVPGDRAAQLKGMLDAAPDSCYNTLATVKTHSPVVILIISIFLGGLGIDRFMLGDIGLGVCKLLFGWVTGGIWWLVDIFLTYRRAKVKNFENIAAALRAATPPPMQAPPPVQG